MNYTELIGYLAMAFLVISFIPKQVRKVRTINLFACTFFIIYGIMLGLKWPIIISNAMVAIIQMYHLFLVKKKADIAK
ncbi:MAG: uroporphyrinogen decarboxylase [Bacteroidia bacterium]|nr:uroporphyrinogen decarboxylase [Bacteroidia bacterium]